MMQFLFLFALVGLTLARDPVKCIPSQTFEGAGLCETVDRHGAPEHGHFSWGHDMNTHKSYEDYRFKNHELNHWGLEDYGNQVRWTMYNGTCAKRSYFDPQMNVWAWLDHAIYNGTREWHGQTLHIWIREYFELPVPYRVETACSELLPSVPMFYNRHEPGRFWMHDFEHFTANVDPAHFEPLPICPKTLTRSTESQPILPSPPQIAAQPRVRAPVKCIPPYSFETSGICRTVDIHGHPDEGFFHWGHDMDNKKSMQSFHHFRTPDMNYWGLEDYLNHVRWAELNGTCLKHYFPDEQSDVWGWLQDAIWNGTREWYGQTVDVWIRDYYEPPVRFHLSTACSELLPHIPLYYQREEPGREFFFDFDHFSSKPDPKKFEPLENCPK
jgi:hypothetical protein